MARDKLGDKVVPRVILEATHMDTLVGYSLQSIGTTRTTHSDLAHHYCSPFQEIWSHP